MVRESQNHFQLNLSLPLANNLQFPSPNTDADFFRPFAFREISSVLRKGTQLKFVQIEGEQMNVERAMSSYGCRSWLAKARWLFVGTLLAIVLLGCESKPVYGQVEAGSVLGRANAVT